MSVDLLASLATVVVPVLIGIVVLIVIVRFFFRR